MWKCNEIINVYDLKEDKNGIPREYQWYETKYIEIPEIIGKSVKEAKKLLKSFNIEYSGSGQKIVDVSPAEGSKVKEGGTVKLLLN